MCWKALVIKKNKELKLGFSKKNKKKKQGTDFWGAQTPNYLCRLNHYYYLDITGFWIHTEYSYGVGYGLHLNYKHRTTLPI